MRYERRKAQAISFPIGGIGTGSIGLSGNGCLIDWEIKNRPDKCSNNGFSFFAVKAEKDGKLVDARVLNGDQFLPYQGMPHVENFAGYGFGPERCTLAGAPHFRDCVFEGSYPYAKIEFGEEKFPGKPLLHAFNPFIPSNEEESGIPAAFFAIEIYNNTKDDMDYTIAGSLQNCAVKAVNKQFSAGKIKGVFLDSVETDHDAPSYGNLAIATDAEKCDVQEYWFRGAWFDALSVFWQDFTASGKMRERTYNLSGVDGYPGTKDVCTVCAHVSVPAGAKKAVRFVISWSFPNYTNYWNPVNEEETGLKNTWKNYYATRFQDSENSACYALENWDRLDASTRAFHDALHGSTLPADAIDAISGTMSVLKTPTCIRLSDGSFYGWEGLHSTSGSCEGTCTHVWNYAYAMPFLFPRLERNLRETNYRYNQDEIGGMHFRTMLPMGRKFWDFRPCADGQFGDVMKTYREWKLLGDNEWLKKLWPNVKKSVEYAWNPANPDKWDVNADGVLEGRQHHTLDMELFGPNGWLNGFYLGALKAASEMARAMGDEIAEKFEAIYANGREWVDKNLFNGKYYSQQVNLKNRDILKAYGEDAYKGYWNDEAQEVKYQIENGCSIDQVTAQWHANLIGLGDIMDTDHVKSALKSIYNNNFKCMRDHFNPCRLYSINDECGTVMCEWPEGVKKPVIPIPYAEETMYGFEYQAAVGMLQNGMLEEGLELISSIRARHNGENRNPWNEMECGSNYARSMASYSALIALTGYEFDMTRSHIGFNPKLNKDAFKTFWSADNVWGEYSQCASGAKLNALYGQITLKSFKADGHAASKVCIGGENTAFEMKNGDIVFHKSVTINAEASLVIQF